MENYRKKKIISFLCWIVGIVFICRARIEYSEKPINILFYNIAVAFYAFSNAYKPQVFLDPLSFKSFFTSETSHGTAAKLLTVIANISLFFSLATGVTKIFE